MVGFERLFHLPNVVEHEIAVNPLLPPEWVDRFTLIADIFERAGMWNERVELGCARSFGCCSTLGAGGFTRAMASQAIPDGILHCRKMLNRPEIGF